MEIQYLKKNTVTTQQELQKVLDQAKSIPVQEVNWPAFPYAPKVEVKVVCTLSEIILEFTVEEDGIRGLETTLNGEVWFDSCCEFFIAFDDKGYYNLEVNCIGTPLLAYGSNNTERLHAPTEVMQAIRTFSTLGNSPLEKAAGKHNYTLQVILPTFCFFKHKYTELPQQFRGNIYKCGDKTPTPHFLSWRPIASEQPNFHLPEFFGTFKLTTLCNN